MFTYSGLLLTLNLQGITQTITSLLVISCMSESKDWVERERRVQYVGGGGTYGSQRKIIYMNYFHTLPFKSIDNYFPESRCMSLMVCKMTLTMTIIDILKLLCFMAMNLNKYTQPTEYSFSA